MKTIIVLTALILVVSFSVTAFAAQEQIGVSATATATKKTAAVATARITAQQKNQIKETVRSYFTPVIHGYGIGFTSETYITAKWQITNVRTLSRVNVNAMIRQAKQGNNTDWDAVRERIRTALSSEPTVVKKGRIRISGTDYALINIVVSEDAATADIVQLPDYTACKNANSTAEECEASSASVGSISLAKKTSMSDANEPNVWAGTLALNSVGYTFVTFVYPR